VRGIEDETADWDSIPFLDYLKREAQAGKVQAIVVTRGIRPLDWPAAKDTHIRRRFALLGQTLDGMRVWDARRALAALRELGVVGEAPVELHGHHAMAAVALWTAVFEPAIQKIVLADPPASVHDGPAFLNLERLLDMPQALALLHPREVVLITATPEAWRWPHALDAALTPGRDWPQFLAPRR
jgi:hypothetical protein